MWSSCWWFELLIIEPQLNGSLCGQSAEAVSRVPRQGFHFQMSTAIRCRGRWLVYVQNLHLLSHDSFTCQQWTTIGAHLLLLYVLATTDHRFRNWHLKPLHWWWHNSHSTLCWRCHLLSGINNESSTSDFLSSTDRPPWCPTDSHIKSDITMTSGKDFHTPNH